jgi:hypothetical protein
MSEEITNNEPQSEKPGHERILDAILGSIDESFNPRLHIGKHVIDAMPTPTSEQIAAIGVEALFSVPKELIAQIRDLQKRFESASQMIEAHVPRKAREAHNEYVASLSAHVLSSESLENHTGRTFEHFETEFREKLKSAKALVNKFGDETFDLVTLHMHRYVQMVNDRADNLAQNERDKYDTFHYPWKPSDFVLRFYKAAQHMEHRLKMGHTKGSGKSPATISDCITIFEDQNEKLPPTWK